MNKFKKVKRLLSTQKGLCVGMDGRESTRIRTPVKTPKRFRSASSPFASPMSDAMLTDSPKVMDSPLSPLVGSSPISGGPSKGLHRYGFKVVRKRRATVQETSSKHAGITGVHSMACSSPIRKTPKREGSLSRAGVRMDFAQPFPPREKRMTEQDYVLQEDNLVSSPDDKVFTSLSEAPIVIDLIKRRPTNLPGNDRRPSALISRRNQSRDHKLGESPVSYRTKRCLSLCSPGMMNSRMRGLRERNRSVNDYNIPKKDLNPALMDQPDLTGYFKRMRSLPSTTSGKHQDLKYINGETLVDLQNGLHNVDQCPPNAVLYNGYLVSMQHTLQTVQAITGSSNQKATESMNEMKEISIPAEQECKTNYSSSIGTPSKASFKSVSKGMLGLI
jgi:hypothetical protein